MIRQFKLSGEQGRIDFTLLWNAFVSRGSEGSDPRNRKQQNKSDYLIEAKISRALKSISDPVGELPADMIIDTRPRKLKSSGGTLTLEQPQHKKLLEYLESCQWGSSVTDIAIDTMERFETCQKIEDAPKLVTGRK